MNKRIVISGPESSGKSAIVQLLTRRIGIPSSPEYARSFLERNGPDYTYDLLLEMSRGHKRHQEKCVPPNSALGIFDTDLINYKIWCNEVYGRCHQEILDGIASESNHVYLLCYPDLSWEPDPLRENRDDRPRLFDLHQAELDCLNRPYMIIRGIGTERFAAAEQAAAQLTG